MKHKLAYYSFLEYVSNVISVGINKNEINTDIKPITLLYMNDFVKNE